ncbi:MAG: DUF4292 domain-containing protein [Bacteroidales bacterium]|nr:DUF4292 domain-containing protein [Bacteroidales bacterium]
MRTQHLPLSALATVIVIFIAMAMSGCRSSKTVADADSLDTTDMTLSERARIVASANQPWTQLNMPVKVSVRSPQKLSLSGRIYMRRDRDIYITLRVLGMEVANMYVNSDSVYAADKVHKYYIAEPIKSVFSGASLTIGDIQDALLGRPFINNQGTITADLLDMVTLSDMRQAGCDHGTSGSRADDAGAIADANCWVMAPRTKINGKIAYQFIFDKADNNLSALTFDTGRTTYGCTYTAPVDIDGSRFMQSIAIATKVGTTAIDASLTFDIGKAKSEVPANARWRQPSGYKRINPRALARALAE